MTQTAFVVLAAGMGTRMKSDLPKVLHRAGGLSLLAHVLTALQPLDPAKICVVVGPDMVSVSTEATKTTPRARTAVQAQRKGTGHAVSMARDALDGFEGTVIVVYGDVPLIGPQTLQVLANTVSDGIDLAVLGFEAVDPHGYGRMVLSADGKLQAIREELDASDEERRIALCNSGVIAVRAAVLWDLLGKIGNNNAKGEYYLTDLIGLGVAGGHGIAHAVCEEREVMGVNDRAQLAQVEDRLQQRYRARAMRDGATLIAPDTVFLSHDTQIGRDVVIEPHVVMLPGVNIGDGAQIRAFCHLEGAVIGNGCSVGPYARLRPGTRLGSGVKVGNFVEVKNAQFEDGSKANHLTYVGDARVGEGANVGAGTITCNYDGFSKHFTDIGRGAFVGSNSALVAPVKIGDGAYIGSGSVVTRDVPANALAVARGKQEIREEWAAKFRARQNRTSKL